jgi:hypothetical protein
VGGRTRSVWVSEGVGRVDQQTSSTLCQVACARLCDRKTPITAADLLNRRVIPLFDSPEVKLMRASSLDEAATIAKPH